MRARGGGGRDQWLAGWSRGTCQTTTMSDRKAVIKNADMSEEMQQDAVECATQALEKYNIEKDIAAHIKKEFDKKYNPTWHCIVGRNFGSYVTHETKHFIYFYLGQVAILLFKSGRREQPRPALAGPTVAEREPEGGNHG
ncbi:dynein light chain 1, cytoplasmic [Patagioenas fasciata monilis]|uniref:Dynein light chain n=1 Tax=Patagioenas fasciata monilis TaxID=372326 RepID=A0A1V4JRA0_PATFA|nr:dynein light chain 1, cytoplasmic [Patagioenas fasciata monilis]